MNVQYFFVMDKIKKGEVKVAFWPTQEMLADFFTKPLQGTLFTRMRDEILNLPCSTSPSSQECVGSTDFSKKNNAETIKMVRRAVEKLGLNPCQHRKMTN